jgi:hypothetical protein
MCNLWWTRWHWGSIFSKYFGFLLSVSFHYCSTLIFISMLPFPEGQVGKAWEPSKHNAVSDTWVHFNEKYFHFRLKKENICKL